MKIPVYPNRRHVTAEEARLVLDHAQRLTQQQWAEFLGVTLATVQAWRSRGFYIGLWSAPSAERWDSLKAEATNSLREGLSLLAGRSWQ